MVVTAFEPNRLVTYTSTQRAFPDASHERDFEPDGEGFVYRLVVEYMPRAGTAGLFDRFLLARGIRRAFEQTFRALERGFASLTRQRGRASRDGVSQPVGRVANARGS